jgi:hypothetical protein
MIDPRDPLAAAAAGPRACARARHRTVAAMVARCAGSRAPVVVPVHVRPSAAVVLPSRRAAGAARAARARGRRRRVRRGRAAAARKRRAQARRDDPRRFSTSALLRPTQDTLLPTVGTPAPRRGGVPPSSGRCTARSSTAAVGRAARAVPSPQGPTAAPLGLGLEPRDAEPPRRLARPAPTGMTAPRSSAAARSGTPPR